MKGKNPVGRPRVYDKAKTEKLHIRVSKEEKEILIESFGEYKISINLRRLMEPHLKRLKALNDLKPIKRERKPRKPRNKIEKNES